MGPEGNRDSALVNLLKSFGDASSPSKGTKRKRDPSEEDPTKDLQMEAILNRLASSIARDHVADVRAHLSKIRIPAEQLRVGSWVNKEGKRQYPLLHYAAREGSVKVLKFLIEEKGLDPDQYAAPVGTVLSRAVHAENEACVQYILTTSCDVNTQVPVCQVRECRMNFVTPLMIALSRHNAENVKMLLDSGRVDINKTTTFNETALCFAIKHTAMSKQYVEMLLEAGIDVNIKSNTDVPPLHLAFKLGRCDVVKQLIQAGCDVNVKQESPGAFGFSALHLAVEMNDCDLVRLLISAGADLEAKSDPDSTLGVTPLVHCVAGNRSYHAMSVLLHAGANFHATDKFGRTIVHWLVLNGDDAPLSFLITSFKNVDLNKAAQDRMPTRPLDYALNANNLKTVKILISQNCKITECREENGGSSLDEALRRGVMADAIQYLHKAGYDVSARVANGLQGDNGKEVGVHASLRHNCTFMTWLKSATCKPRSLQDICRNKIRDQLSNGISEHVEQLPLPTVMKNFIKDID